MSKWIDSIKNNEEPHFYWHLREDSLFNRCYDYGEARAEILENKNKQERELHLRLFKPIEGELPRQYIQALRAKDMAWLAYYKEFALLEHRKFNKEFHTLSHWPYVRPHQLYIETQSTFNLALSTLKQVEKACMSEIEALHSKECPDCPWNTETIFTYTLLTRSGQ